MSITFQQWHNNWTYNITPGIRSKRRTSHDKQKSLCLMMAYLLVSIAKRRQHCFYQHRYTKRFHCFRLVTGFNCNNWQHSCRMNALGSSLELSGASGKRALHIKQHHLYKKNSMSRILGVVWQVTFMQLFHHYISFFSFCMHSHWKWIQRRNLARTV